MPKLLLTIALLALVVGVAHATDAPRIVRVVAGGAGDANIQNGDKISIVFDSNTNRVSNEALTTSSLVNALVQFTWSASAATVYSAAWESKSVLVISFGADAATAVSQIQIVGIILSEDLQSTQVLSGPYSVTGSLDSVPGAPTFARIYAIMSSETLSIGDEVAFLFDANTNLAGQELGTQYTGDDLAFIFTSANGAYFQSADTYVWASPREIRVTINADTNVVVDTSEFEVGKSELSVRDETWLSNSVTGLQKVRPAPLVRILTCVASDTASDEGLRNGDSIVITFSTDTNTGNYGVEAPLTKGEVDSLVSFGSDTVGSQYVGAWTSNSVLVVTISDTAESSLQVNKTDCTALSTIKDILGVFTAEESAVTLSGTFGDPAAPFASSVTAVNTGSQAGPGPGDTIEISFSDATNAGGHSLGTQLTKSEVDGVVSPASQTDSLGADYTGEFVSGTKLVITLVDTTGFRVRIGQTKFKIDTSVTDDTGVTTALRQSAVLTGTFGASTDVKGPELESLRTFTPLVNLTTAQDGVNVTFQLTFRDVNESSTVNDVPTGPSYGQCNSVGLKCDMVPYVVLSHYEYAGFEDRAIVRYVRFSVAEGAVVHSTSGLSVTLNQTITFPLSSPSAHLRVSRVVLYDLNGNELDLDESALHRPVSGFDLIDAEIDIEENGEVFDRNPPYLSLTTTASIATVRLDPTQASADARQTTMTIHVSDDASGLPTTIPSPSEGVSNPNSRVLWPVFRRLPLTGSEDKEVMQIVSITRINGYEGDADYELVIEVPQDTAAGVFVLSHIILRDQAFNWDTVTLFDMLEQNVTQAANIAFLYVGVGPTDADTVAPELFYMSLHAAVPELQGPGSVFIDHEDVFDFPSPDFTPHPKVDRTVRDGMVVARCVVLDPMSGVTGNVNGKFELSTGGNGFAVAMLPPSNGTSHRVSLYEGTVSLDGTFPAGTYTLRNVTVSDSASNTAVIDRASTAVWQKVAPGFSTATLDVELFSKFPVAHNFVTTPSARIDPNNGSVTVQVAFEMYMDVTPPTMGSSTSLGWLVYGPAVPNGPLYRQYMYGTDIVNITSVNITSVVEVVVDVTVPQLARDGMWQVYEVLLTQPGGSSVLLSGSFSRLLGPGMGHRWEVSNSNGDDDNMGPTLEAVQVSPDWGADRLRGVTVSTFAVAARDACPNGQACGVVHASKHTTGYLDGSFLYASTKTLEDAALVSDVNSVRTWSYDYVVMENPTNPDFSDPAVPHGVFSVVFWDDRGNAAEYDYFQLVRFLERTPMFNVVAGTQTAIENCPCYDGLGVCIDFGAAAQPSLQCACENWSDSPSKCCTTGQEVNTTGTDADCIIVELPDTRPPALIAINFDPPTVVINQGEGDASVVVSLTYADDAFATDEEPRGPAEGRSCRTNETIPYCNHAESVLWLYSHEDESHRSGGDVVHFEIEREVRFAEKYGAVVVARPDALTVVMNYTLVVPSTTPSTTMVVGHADLYDAIGNRVSLDGSQLEQLALNLATVSDRFDIVNSNNDTDMRAPGLGNITEFVTSPSQVLARGTDNSVNISMELRDLESGLLDPGRADPRSPQQSARVDLYRMPVDMTYSGTVGGYQTGAYAMVMTNEQYSADNATILRATFTAEVGLPNDEDGVWLVREVSVRDATYNRDRWSTAELLMAGVDPTTLIFNHLAGGSDNGTLPTSPPGLYGPQLLWLLCGASPSYVQQSEYELRGGAKPTIDVTVRSATVYCRAAVVSARSTFSAGEFELVADSDGGSAVAFSWSLSELVYGDERLGVYDFVSTVPQGRAQGKYIVKNNTVRLSDAEGATRNVSLVDNNIPPEGSQSSELSVWNEFPVAHGFAFSSQTVNASAGPVNMTLDLTIYSSAPLPTGTSTKFGEFWFGLDDAGRYRVYIMGNHEVGRDGDTVVIFRVPFTVPQHVRPGVWGVRDLTLYLPTESRSFSSDGDNGELDALFDQLSEGLEWFTVVDDPDADTYVPVIGGVVFEAGTDGNVLRGVDAVTLELTAHDNCEVGTCTSVYGGAVQYYHVDTGYEITKMFTVDSPYHVGSSGGNHTFRVPVYFIESADPVNSAPDGAWVMGWLAVEDTAGNLFQMLGSAVALAAQYVGSINSTSFTVTAPERAQETDCACRQRDEGVCVLVDATPTCACYKRNDDPSINECCRYGNASDVCIIDPDPTCSQTVSEKLSMAMACMPELVNPDVAPENVLSEYPTTGEIDAFLDGICTRSCYNKTFLTAIAEVMLCLDRNSINADSETYLPAWQLVQTVFYSCTLYSGTSTNTTTKYCRAATESTARDLITAVDANTTPSLSCPVLDTFGCCLTSFEGSLQFNASYQDALSAFKNDQCGITFENPCPSPLELLNAGGGDGSGNNTAGSYRPCHEVFDGTSRWLVTCLPELLDDNGIWTRNLSDSFLDDACSRDCYWGVYGAVLKEVECMLEYQAETTTNDFDASDGPKYMARALEDVSNIRYLCTRGDAEEWCRVATSGWLIAAPGINDTANSVEETTLSDAATCQSISDAGCCARSFIDWVGLASAPGALLQERAVSECSSSLESVPACTGAPELNVTEPCPALAASVRGKVPECFGPLMGLETAPTPELLQSVCSQDCTFDISNELDEWEECVKLHFNASGYSSESVLEAYDQFRFNEATPKFLRSQIGYYCSRTPCASYQGGWYDEETGESNVTCSAAAALPDSCCVGTFATWSATSNVLKFGGDPTVLAPLYEGALEDLLNNCTNPEVASFDITETCVAVTACTAEFAAAEAAYSECFSDIQNFLLGDGQRSGSLPSTMLWSACVDEASRCVDKVSVALSAASTCLASAQFPWSAPRRLSLMSNAASFWCSMLPGELVTNNSTNAVESVVTPPEFCASHLSLLETQFVASQSAGPPSTDMCNAAAAAECCLGLLDLIDAPGLYPTVVNVSTACNASLPLNTSACGDLSVLTPCFTALDEGADALDSCGVGPVINMDPANASSLEAVANALDAACDDTTILQCLDPAVSSLTAGSQCLALTQPKFAMDVGMLSSLVPFLCTATDTSPDIGALERRWCALEIATTFDITVSLDGISFTSPPTCREANDAGCCLRTADDFLLAAGVDDAFFRQFVSNCKLPPLSLDITPCESLSTESPDPPTISGVTLHDSGNQPGQGNGDSVTIEFDKPTNAGGFSSRLVSALEISKLVAPVDGYSWGVPLFGEWRGSNDVLVIFLGSSAAELPDGALPLSELDESSGVRVVGLIRDQSGRSAVSTSVFLGPDGTFGEAKPPPVLEEARLGDSGLAARLFFDSPTDQGESVIGFAVRLGYFDCASILTSETVAKFVSPACLWVRDRELVVIFAPSVEKPSVGDMISVLPGVVRSSGGFSALATDVESLSQSLQAPVSPPTPVAKIASPRAIGSCENLVMDASLSTGAAGRPFQYNWQFIAAYEYPGQGVLTLDPAKLQAIQDALAAAGRVVILDNSILTTGSIHVFSLSVSNWLEESSAPVYHFAIIETESIPRVFIEGAVVRTVRGISVNTVSAGVALSPCLAAGLGGTDAFALLRSDWTQLTSLTAQERQSLGSVDDTVSDTVLSIPSDRRTGKFLVLDAGLLQPGQSYAFKVTVRASGLPNAPSNSAVVLLRVLPSDLVVRISGGRRDYSVDSVRPLVLDAGTSFDPDDPTEADGELEFSWSCFLSDGTVCGLPAPVALNESSLTVPGSTMYGNEVYFFSVSVSKTSLATGLVKNAQRSTYVRTVVTPVPIVFITAPRVNVDQYDPARALFLLTSVLNADDNLPARFQDYTFQWSVKTDNLVLNEQTTLAPPDGPFLAVKPNSMVFNTDYVFAMTVTRRDAPQVTATAEFSLMTTSVPVGGSCSLDVDSVEPWDEMTVSCIDWEDDRDALPLKYSFRLLLADGTEQRISNYRESNSLQLVAPGADFSQSTSVPLSLRVIIVNRFGGRSTVDVQFQLNEPTVAPGELVNYVEEKVLDKLVKLQTTNDFEGLYQVVFGATSFLANLGDVAIVHAKRRLPPTSSKLELETRESMFQTMSEDAADSAKQLRKSLFDVIKQFDNKVKWTPETILTQVSMLFELTSVPEQVANEIRVAALQFLLDKIVQLQSRLPRTSGSNAEDGVADPTVEERPDQYVQNAFYAVSSIMQSALTNLRSNSTEEARAEARQLSTLYLDFLQTTSAMVTPRKVAGEDPLHLPPRDGQGLAFVQGRVLAEDMVGANLGGDSGSTFKLPDNFWAQLGLSADNVSEASYVVTQSLDNIFSWFEGEAHGLSDTDYYDELVNKGLYLTPTVSITIRDGDGNEIDVSDLDVGDAIYINITHHTPLDLDQISPDEEWRPVCQWWDTDEERWDISGCQVVASTETHTTCLCTHLTEFNSEYSSIKPEVQSVTADDFRNLTVKNLMNHPTTLIGVGLALLLYLMLVPYARRVDRLNMEKYKDIIRRNSMQAEDGAVRKASKVLALDDGGSRRTSANVHPEVEMADVSLPHGLGSGSFDEEYEPGASGVAVSSSVVQIIGGATEDGDEQQQQQPIGALIAPEQGRRRSSGDAMIAMGGLPSHMVADAQDGSSSGDEDDSDAGAQGDRRSREELRRDSGATGTETTYNWRSNKLLHNWVTSFRHRHLWLSVVFRHPRDSVSSVQRLSCLLGLVLGTLAVNAMFYGTNQLVADLFVAIISSIAVLPTTVVLMFLFRGGSCNSRPIPKNQLAVNYRDPKSLCPNHGRKIAWTVWALWCAGCALIALAMGLQFDLKEEEEGDKDQLISSNTSSVAARWLVSCAFSFLQDMFLNRPLIISARVFVCGDGAVH